MRTLLFRAAAMFLGTVLWSVPASAQPYIYTVSDAFGSLTGGSPTFPPVATPLLEVRSSSSMAVLGTLQLGSVGYVSDIALGPGDRKLYVAVRSVYTGVPGSLYVVDAVSNTLTKTLTFSPPSTTASPWGPMALAASPDRSLIYVARQAPDGITVIRTSDDTVVNDFALAGPPQAVAISPDGVTLYVAVSGPRQISFINTATGQETGAVALAKIPASVAVTANGSRLFVGAADSLFMGSGGEIEAIDTASRQIVGTVAATGAPNALLLSPDEAKLFAGTKVLTGGFGNWGQLDVVDTASLTRTTSLPVCAGADGVADPPRGRAYFAGTCGVHNVGSMHVIDMSTATSISSATIVVPLSSIRIALGTPGGCTYEMTPPAAFGPGGGSGTVTMTAPAGCPWTISSGAAWVQFTSATAAPAGSVSGSGSATVGLVVSPSTGEPRSATLTSGFQHVTVKQTQPLAWIDEPAAGTTVNQPFTVRGWAIDRDDDPGSGGSDSGVDAVHVWAYPVAGAPTFLGVAERNERLDLAAVYGSKYRFAGFTLQARGVTPGAYTIVAYAHSARSGAFFPAVTTATVSSVSKPVVAIDAPRAEESLTQPFAFAGWAADLAAAAGTGVDAVHVWAYPDSGGHPIFVGAAQYGIWPRPDVAAVLRIPALTQSGFLLRVDGLTPGGYTFVAYAHSSVTGVFAPRTVHVNVGAEAQPVIHIDAVQAGTGSVTLAGWAVDTRASSGSGVSALHLWAYPAAGGPPVFLGAATPSATRDVPALLFGSQFADSGWNLTSPLAPGAYQVVLYALSAVTGSFDNVRVVAVTVR